VQHLPGVEELGAGAVENDERPVVGKRDAVAAKQIPDVRRIIEIRRYECGDLSATPFGVLDPTTSRTVARHLRIEVLKAPGNRACARCPGTKSNLPDGAADVNPSFFHPNGIQSSSK
jgi:hypothetical protein